MPPEEPPVLERPPGIPMIPEPDEAWSIETEAQLLSGDVQGLMLSPLRFQVAGRSMAAVLPMPLRQGWVLTRRRAPFAAMLPFDQVVLLEALKACLRDEDRSAVLQLAAEKLMEFLVLVRDWEDT